MLYSAISIHQFECKYTVLDHLVWAKIVSSTTIAQLFIYKPLH